MRSTFMGLETSKRGMFTQQSALYTTGHNISNANTPGYTRQRVNMQPTLGYPGTGLTAPTTPGFIGTGVEAGSVQRIRDSFVDQQFRQESNKLGYWESRSKAISQMEDVLNEPSEFGLAKSLDEFWKSLQDLSVNPENGGARAVVVQRGIAVSESFNYMHKSLSDIKADLGNEIGVANKNVNSILTQLADLNRQIQEVEPNGYMPNDLYDARDNLLDQLSNYFPIEVEYTESGGRALEIAEGSVTVTIKMKNGDDLKVVDGRDFAQLRVKPTNANGKGLTPNDNVTSFQLVKVDDNDEIIAYYDENMNEVTVTDPNTEALININNFSDLGQMKSLVKSFGYVDGSEVKGLYPDMIKELDKLALEFAEAFNEVHVGNTNSNPPVKPGRDLNGAAGENFFVVRDTYDTTNLTAGNIYINQNIIDNPGKVAASDADSNVPEVGNGNNAKNLADIFSKPIDDLEGVSIQSYFQGIIGQLGVDGQQAQRLAFNSETLRNSVDFRRQSIHSVSLDEEMTNMIKFQQAYNASARMITVVDETLDKIINGMGRVGL